MVRQNDSPIGGIVSRTPRTMTVLQAQKNIGLMYYNGESVPQDYDKAVKWYRMAAEQGYGFGRRLLGKMYEDGHGVPQNYVYSHMWYNLAGERGSKIGEMDRDNVAKKMTPAQIAEAQRLASEWKPKK